MRVLLATLVLFVATNVIYAQNLLGFPPGMFSGRSAGSPAAVPYVGPGDVVSGATAWYGLRAYNQAYALATGNAVNIRCSSGSGPSSTNIKVLTSGALDMSTLLSTCPDDGAITASIAGTVLSITAISSGTVVAFDNIIGTGVTGGTYVTTAGTCLFGAVSPPCTFNLNQASTVSSETMRVAASIQINTWYDQSGANACSGSVPCNLAGNAAGSSWPWIVPNELGSFPGVRFVGNTALLLPQTLASSYTTASYSTVARRTADSGATEILIGSFTSGNDPVFAYFTGSASVGVYAGAILPRGMTPSVFSAVQGVQNGASSAVNVDGGDTTGAAGAGSTVTKIDVGSNVIPNTFFLFGDMMEVGIWTTTLFTLTQRNNLCHNQFAYWGTATSC